MAVQTNFIPGSRISWDRYLNGVMHLGVVQEIGEVGVVIQLQTGHRHEVDPRMLKWQTDENGERLPLTTVEEQEDQPQDYEVQFETTKWYSFRVTAHSEQEAREVAEGMSRHQAWDESESDDMSFVDVNQVQ